MTVWCLCGVSVVFVWCLCAYLTKVMSGYIESIVKVLFLLSSHTWLKLDSAKKEGVRRSKGRRLTLEGRITMLPVSVRDM